MNYPLYPADPNRDPAELFRNLDSAPTTRPVTTIEPRPEVWDDVIDATPLSTEELVERQRERFGGVKIGSAFFGWLIATATFAILTGLVTVAGVVLGLDVRNPLVFARELPLDLATVGWIGAGTLLAILFSAFYCGGYVAGRMARFNGVAQGIAVWVWTIVIAIVARSRRVRARPIRRAHRPGPAPAHPRPRGDADHRGHRDRGRSSPSRASAARSSAVSSACDTTGASIAPRTTCSEGRPAPDSAADISVASEGRP